ncbi:hypothetical protein N8703_02550 [Verrucomicrobia bacterium]|nr:hypothetical protein [Verrucomicrobiota bacterium]
MSTDYSKDRGETTSVYVENQGAGPPIPSLDTEWKEDYGSLRIRDFPHLAPHGIMLVSGNHSCKTR